MRTGLSLFVFLFIPAILCVEVKAQDTFSNDVKTSPGPSHAQGSAGPPPSLTHKPTLKGDLKWTPGATLPLSLPKDLPTQNFGFFCRQELQLSRKNIPIRFRLGSMEYCNYLEQKPGYKLVPANR